MLPDVKMEDASAAYLYGHQSSDFLHIDDLLDFSNEDIFDSSSSDASSYNLPLPESSNGVRPPAGIPDVKPFRTNFSDDLCLPSDDVAELEWLSKFVDDSFSDLPFPAGGNEMSGNSSSRPEASVPGRARSKRSRVPATNSGWITVSPPASELEIPFQAAVVTASEPGKGKGGGRRRESVSGDVDVRKCTHCAAEKTPQWRTGPMGPKSLCNACGVRYKSGRLVPEYRPAASPTFVLTQHSNSHRKVMELRRQKEIHHRQENFHDFQVC